MAHVVLPESSGTAAGGRASSPTPPYPSCSHEVTSIGATRSRLSAVLVGGAQMFATAGRLDIGARNEHAVRAALRPTGSRARRSDRRRHGPHDARLPRELLDHCKEAGRDEVEIATWGGLAQMARAA